METWNIVILALIGTCSAIVALIGLKVRANTKSIGSVEDRLVIAEDMVELMHEKQHEIEHLKQAMKGYIDPSIMLEDVLKEIKKQERKEG